MRRGLVVLAAALSVGGCIPYKTGYRIDPRSQKVFTRPAPGKETVGGYQLAITGAPTAANPAAPISVSALEVWSAAEQEVTTAQEHRYRRYWSPFLIPVGIFMTVFPITHVVICAGVEGPKYFSFKDNERNSCPEPNVGLRHWLGMAVGIAPPFKACYEPLDSRPYERVRSTGKTLSGTRPLLKSATIRTTLVSNAGARVVIADGPFPLDQWGGNFQLGGIGVQFGQFPQTPASVTIRQELLAPGTAVAEATLDAATCEALHRPWRDRWASEAAEKAAAAAESAGDLAGALARASEAFALAVATDREAGLWKRVADLYRRRPGEPAVPEAARKLLVQAEHFMGTNDPASARRAQADAVRQVPWLPVGHYNLAFAHAALKEFPQAIAEMRRYLELEPASPEAAALQDQIYRWETGR